MDIRVDGGISSDQDRFSSIHESLLNHRVLG